MGLTKLFNLENNMLDINQENVYVKMTKFALEKSADKLDLVTVKQIIKSQLIDD